MRYMSFSITTEQIAAGTKDVTRRMGWERLQAGDKVLPAKKCMGLKRGEKIEPLRGPLQAINVRREALRRMTDDPEYGREECRREGFPHLTPEEFVEMFCSTHRGTVPDSVITRIEFEYLD